MAHLDRTAVWQRPDGGVSITYFDTRDMRLGESEDAFIERMSLKHAPPGAVKTIVNKSDIPTDRNNRNEWSIKNGKVEVDSVKLKAKNDKKAEVDNLIAKLGLTQEEYDKLP